MRGAFSEGEGAIGSIARKSENESLQPTRANISPPAVAPPRTKSSAESASAPSAAPNGAMGLRPRSAALSQTMTSVTTPRPPRARRRNGESTTISSVITAMTTRKAKAWRLRLNGSTSARLFQARVEAVDVRLHLLLAALVDDLAAGDGAGVGAAVARRRKLALHVVHAFAEHDRDPGRALGVDHHLHGLPGGGDAHRDLLDVHAAA